MLETQPNHHRKEVIPLEHVLCWLSACGIGIRTICEVLELEENEAKVLLDQDVMKLEVKRAKARFFGKDPKGRFRAMSERAMEVAEDLLGDDTQKAGIRLKAASEIFDRSFGKPEQTLNMEGSLIRRLMERMDEQEKAAPPKPQETFDIGSLSLPAPESVEGDPNPGIREWVEKNLP